MSLACLHAVKRGANGSRIPLAKPTEIVIAIDTSSSMSYFSSTLILKSVNDLIKTQKPILPPSPGFSGTTLSVLTFSNTVRRHYDKVPISGPTQPLPEIKYDTIRPHGSTALYDAFQAGLSILSFSSKTSKILLIITDGLENSSKHVTHNKLVSIIKKSVDDGVLIKFLGGGQDAVAVGIQLGIPEDCCLSFSNDDHGMDNAIGSASKSLERHTLGKCHSFTPMERMNSLSMEQPTQHVPMVSGGGLGRISTKSE